MTTRNTARQIMPALIALFALMSSLDDRMTAHSVSSDRDDATDLRMTLTPKSSKTGEVLGVQVSYVLTMPSQKADLPISLLFDSLQPALQRTHDQVMDLAVADELGELRFNGPSDQRRIDGTDKVWQSTRSTQGEVRTSYYVPVALPQTPKRGPHIDLQAAGGGISGAFVSFLLVPEIKGRVRFHLHWELPVGQEAVTTYGSGDMERDMTLSELKTMIFLAGPLEDYSSPLSRAGIHFDSLGLPAKQLKDLADWTSKLYVSERRAFHGRPDKPFRFLIRSYEGGPIVSGRADSGAFMLYIPAGAMPDPFDLHTLIAHEMVHALIKDLDDASGDEGDWYTEGTADYFAIVLPYQTGLYTSCEYVKAINQEAALYYTNTLRNVPNAEITHVMWSGRNAWTIPYARGALYFADLEAKLKNRHSAFDVLALVNEMSERISGGAPATNQTWNTLLTDRVGAWAVSDWSDMLSGKLILPNKEAFGQTVVRVPVRIGVFDLGFADPKNLPANAVVHGVEPGSPAAHAGLDDGDVIAKSMDLNPVYRTFTGSIRLHVVRDHASRTLTFDPHVGSHLGGRWTFATHDTLRQNECRAFR